jgi:hypothetical protein
LERHLPFFLFRKARRQASLELANGIAEVVTGVVARGWDLSGCDSAGCCRRRFLLELESGDFVSLWSGELPNSLAKVARRQFRVARSPVSQRILSLDWQGEPTPVVSWDSFDFSNLPIDFFPKSECEVIPAASLPAEVRGVLYAA